MIFDKNDNNSEILGRVSLFLNGLELDPDQITNTLLLDPNKNFKKGDVYISSSGKQIIRKLGRWCYKLPKSPNIILQINNLLDILEGRNFDLMQLHNIDNAYIDVFITKNIVDGDVNFNLNLDVIQRIEKLKLSLRFELHGFD